MSNGYPQWGFEPPRYDQSLHLETGYDYTVGGQDIQRAYSHDSSHQMGYSSSLTPSPSNSFASSVLRFPNQVTRSLSADQSYVPNQVQHPQNHYANSLDVGNSLATGSQVDFPMSASSFGFPTSGGSLSPGGSVRNGPDRIAAPFLTSSPDPLQGSFPPKASLPSTSSNYYQSSTSSVQSSLPPKSVKRPRIPDTVTDEDDDPAETREDVKVKSRACARCKNLKVRCEFKTDTDPCKRCMNGGHDCVIPGKKKRRTPPKREHLMNEIREQAERIRALMSQLEDANQKLRQPGSISDHDVSSQSSASSPPALSHRSSSYNSLETSPNLDAETNKNITAWISKAKESFAEFDGFLSSGGAGVPKSYFVDRDLEDSPSEDDGDDLNGEYGFAIVSDGDEWHPDDASKSSKARTTSISSNGSNATRGSPGASVKRKEGASNLPSEAVPFGLMANLSLRKHRQRGASAEVEDQKESSQVGVANDDFFSSPSLEPRRTSPPEVQLPHILAREIITTSEAEELFQIYFDRMNISLSLVDPVLYTAQTTCYRSPFMFTVICAIASRYYIKRPDLYDRIIQYAQMAAGSALITGVKNVEMCIGYILLSLYPVPSRNWQDQRGWMYLGLAIRTAMDINLHLPNTAKPMNELHEREMLNRTRVWMNCFNLDRSTGSQNGKLPVISNMDYTANHIHNWWRTSAYNMVNFDIHTCCYSAELRVMAKFISKIYSDPNHPTGLNKEIDFAGIATETDEELKSLKETWMEILNQTDMTDRQNRFRTGLLKLAFSYARLAALSFGFQHAFGKNQSNENPFLLRCLAAAYDVVDVTINELGTPEQRIYLRYGPEAQTVFVTFAATFLIKLLQPKYAVYIDETQRKYICHLVQSVVELLGSPEVAVDERHSPKLYSRFLKELLAVTLTEKKVHRQSSYQRLRKNKSTSSSGSPNISDQAALHNASSSVYSTSPMMKTTVMQPTTNTMDYNFGLPMGNSHGGANTQIPNFLTPDPEFFRTPLPFDEDMLSSMHSIADSSTSWALPGFDWMTNYRAPNA